VNIPFEGRRRRMDSREAADTGLLLWRENFIGFMLFFAIPFWVCAFSLRLLPGKAQYLSWAILWLLKPLFERPILHVISVRFFENSAGMKRLFRDLGKSILRGLPGDLLWRRFSPLRAAMMPVRILEMHKKPFRETAKRRELLEKGGLGYCFILSFWGIALEAALLTGEILFFILMSEFIYKVSFSMELLKSAEIYVFAAWCFNYMLVETIYVCMGFSLYINSRMEVEGWDIEIMFRSFAEKLRKKKAVEAISKSSALIVLCLICLFLPVKTFAAGFEPDKDVPVEKLQIILASPDFGGEKDSWGIRLKDPLKQRDAPNFNFSPILEKLRWIFSFILRLILVVLIAVLIFFLFLYARKYIHKKNYTVKKTATTVINGIPAENPELLLEKAENFHKQQNFRMAWGYCTATAILFWQLYRGFNFPPNPTESDCANMVSSMPSGTYGSPCNADEAHTFCQLINRWVNFAYAGRLPAAGSFEEAAAFCKLLANQGLPGSADE